MRTSGRVNMTQTCKISKWSVKPGPADSWSVLKDGITVSDKIGTLGQARGEMRRLAVSEIQASCGLDEVEVILRAAVKYWDADCYGWVGSDRKFEPKPIPEEWMNDSRGKQIIASRRETYGI